MTTNLQMTRTTWLLLALLSVFWGGSFFFVELALRDLPTLTIVFFRVAIAAVALHLYLLFKSKKISRDIKIWFNFLIMGLLNNLIPFSLIVWGQVFIEAGLASILNATTPIFTVILAHFLLKDEKMTRNKIFGVVLGLVGVVVLIGLEPLQGFSQNILAQLAVIGAAVSYAFAGIYGRRFKDIEAIYTATGMLTSTAIIMLPIALIVDRPWHLSPSFISVLAILGSALVSTVAAYLIYFHILSVAGATNVLLVTMLIPVSAVLLSSLFLGERLHWTAFAGMVLIILALVVVDGRSLRRLLKR